MTTWRGLGAKAWAVPFLKESLVRLGGKHLQDIAAALKVSNPSSRLSGEPCKNCTPISSELFPECANGAVHAPIKLRKRLAGLRELRQKRAKALCAEGTDRVSKNIDEIDLKSYSENSGRWPITNVETGQTGRHFRPPTVPAPGEDAGGRGHILGYRGIWIPRRLGIDAPVFASGHRSKPGRRRILRAFEEFRARPSLCGMWMLSGESIYLEMRGAGLATFQDFVHPSDLRAARAQTVRTSLWHIRNEARWLDLKVEG